MATRTSTHPLIGKFAMVNSTDGTKWRVSRFDADLGNGLFLMRHFGPRKEDADLGSSYILNISSLIGEGKSDIYDSWEDFWEDMVCHCDQCKGERIHTHTSCPHCDSDDDEEEELIEDEEDDEEGGVSALPYRYLN